MLYKFVLILLVSLPLIILSTAGVIKEIKRNRYYRLFYKTLPLKKFYRSNEYVYSHHCRQTNDGFIWFLNSNVFSFGDGKYLYNAIMDPVALYWRRKFLKWFKENISVDYLPEYNQFPSYFSSIRTEDEFPSPYAYDVYLRRYYASIVLKTFAGQHKITNEDISEVVKQVSKLVAELRFNEKKEKEQKEAVNDTELA